MNRSWKAYAWYSLFFAVLCFFVFLPFVQENRSLLWNPDAVVYHIPMAETFTEMLKTVLSGNVFSLYDLSVGMGTDMLQYTSQWYAEPLNLLYAFFGAKAAEKIYTLLIFVRLYLCGAMFLVFSELITENDRAAVSGALVYVFSGYTLFTGTKAAPFLVAMILLPLIFYTAEMFRKEKRAIWFMLVIAFSAVFSYYFLFMNSILLAVYVLIGVFARRDTARDAVCYITRLIGFYLVGLCMGCVTFLPSVAGFWGSSRSSGARNVKSLLHYDAEYYKDLVTGLFQARINHDYWLVLGFTPLLILAFLFLIRQKDAIAARLKMAWTVLGIGVCVPLFGCVTNGGMVANNRWLYALVFVAGVTFAKTYPDLVKWLGSVFGGAKKAEKRCEVLWCTALVLSLALGGNSLFADAGEGFAGEFHKLGSGYKTMTNNTNMKMAKVEDDALYRVDAARTPKTASSAWVAGDYRGLVTNASGYSKEMADFYRYFENAGVITSFRLAGMDNSTILTSLAGVKYYTAKEEQEARLPYGYEKIRDNIYQNKYAVPFNYSYGSYAVLGDTANLTPVQKQEVVLRSAIVDDETAKVLEEAGLEKDVLPEAGFVSEKLTYEIANQDGVVISEDGTTFRTESKGAGFDLIICDIPGPGEVYLEYKGVSILSENVKAATIDMRENDVLVSGVSFQKKNATYSSGNDTYAANIGYSAAAERKIHVSFTQKAEYKIDEINVYYLPLSQYEEQCLALTEDVMNITEWADEEIVGTASVKRKKMLCIPLIYSDGWHVEVDGEPKELYKVNLMYCGVLLDEGQHEIRWYYETPYLKLGLCVTLLGLFVFGLCIRAQRKKD